MHLSNSVILAQIAKFEAFLFNETVRISPIDLSFQRHVFKPLFAEGLRRSFVNATSYTIPTMSSNRLFVSGENQDAYSCLPMLFQR